MQASCCLSTPPLQLLVLFNTPACGYSVAPPALPRLAWQAKEHIGRISCALSDPIGIAVHDAWTPFAYSRCSALQAEPSREVLHAISVCEAMQADSYKTCFKLYASAPRMGRALMDIAYPNLRFDALRMLCEGFRPTLTLPHAAHLLGFLAGASQPDLQEQNEEIPPGSSQPRFPGKHAAAVSFHLMSCSPRVQAGFLDMLYACLVSLEVYVRRAGSAFLTVEICCLAQMLFCCGIESPTRQTTILVPVSTDDGIKLD